MHDLKLQVQYALLRGGPQDGQAHLCRHGFPQRYATLSGSEAYLGLPVGEQEGLRIVVTCVPIGE